MLAGMLWPLATTAVDMAASLTATGQWAQGIGTGETQALNGSLRPELDLFFLDDWRFTVSVRLRSEARDGMQPGDIGRGAYSPYSKPALLHETTELALRQFFFQGQIGDTHLTIGKQQVVWGKADGLKVLDVVDPQSFREFILEDFDDSRIPLWTVNIERQIGDWTWQLLWIPDPTFHAIPKPSATYAFTSPELVPTAPPGVTVKLNDPKRPSRSLKDSDAGLRVTTFWQGWDLTLNYLYQYDNLPVLRQSIAWVEGKPVVTITPEYERTHVLGTTFSTAMGDWVIRGEMGYFSRKFFIGRDTAHRGVVKSPLLHYVLGLDWNGPADIFFSGQLIQSWMLKRAHRSTRDQLDTSLTLLMRRLFLYDTLTAEVLVIANLNHGDGIVRPKLGYQWLDNLEIWLGADVFFGDRDGVFGQFGANDRLVLGIEAAF
ncbi:MAG: hypothetical protein AXA67_11275 [Methylothermaceae bacteria B42]|nr:MAG: hypothetical protein AXA67_11275 [Methylothermaceae bacteria B42]